MARFNFREAELGDDDLDDEERRGIVRDGEGVRVPLMWADGDENIRWIAPQPVRQRVADSAPPAFDWTVLCRPGYRTFEMLRDAAAALTLDAAGDPVHEARQQRIARQGTMWKDWLIASFMRPCGA
jgi:hypothetical protein